MNRADEVAHADARIARVVAPWGVLLLWLAFMVLAAGGAS